MFESIYIGMTGLTAFSRNLTVIGNNTSNINSPGFKGSELSFSDLVYNNLVADGSGSPGSPLQFGNGVGASATRVLFKQGTINQTGNDTDLAIDGNGFFVLRANGNSSNTSNGLYGSSAANSASGVSYTRSGSFQFDANGFLVSNSSGARVAAFSSGALQDFNIGGLRVSPPQATSVFHFLNNLSSGGTTQDVSVKAFDGAGGNTALTVHLTNNSTVTPGSWLVEVRDAGGGVLPGASGEIRFSGDGSPAAGFNTFTFTFSPPGAPAQSITLDFGTPGGFSGATNFSAGTTSTLSLGSQDGFGAGSLTKATFDANGVLTATYSNGQTARGPQIALAFFDSPQDLTLAGGTTFENRSGQKAILGSPGAGLFGSITGQSLEAANVDLATQFGELIITQRGYQASSQVITTANDMIQQLFDMKTKR